MAADEGRFNDCAGTDEDVVGDFEGIVGKCAGKSLAEVKLKEEGEVPFV